MRVEHIGYGAGTRNPAGFPNVLRLTVGESALDQPTGTHLTDEVIVLETALDDFSPQVLAYVSEQALALGALDVMLAPVQMKKGRPGTLLTLLCTAGHGVDLRGSPLPRDLHAGHSHAPRVPPHPRT